MWPAISSFWAVSRLKVSRCARIRSLVEQQQALRHVATLVASGARPQAAFQAVAGEVGSLFKADYVSICRYEPGDVMCLVASPGLSVGGHPVPPTWARLWADVG